MYCVCLCIKLSTKLQISKSTPKGKPFSGTTAKGLFELQSCFPLFVTSQIVNPAYWNSTCGRTLGWVLHVSKSKPSAGVFISPYFWWKPTVFRKCFVIFISSRLIKQRLWTDVCFVYSVTGALYHYNSTSRWQRINASLWDYGINKFNCITVSMQFML